MRTPHYALRFGRLLATEMLEHGFRQGASRAAAKVSPVLMVLEAAASVADAIDSYLQYCSTKVHRDALKELIPLEEVQLRAVREQLGHEIERIRCDMGTQQHKQLRLGALFKLCAHGLRMTWEELENLRRADLPELDLIDRQTGQLEDAWHDFKRATAHYQELTS